MSDVHVAADAGSARVFHKASISIAAALALVEAARAASAAASLKNSVAVLDGGGNLMAFARMDGASLTSGQVAIDKAFTALSGRPSHIWHTMVEGDEVLQRGARLQIPRLVTIGGGYPIFIDGAVVGGLGISGGHYSQDMDVAQQALAALGAKSDW